MAFAFILPMAGLGLFFHKSALALAPRGLLQSACGFLCLIYHAQKGPGHYKRVQGSLIRARSYAQKTWFGPPSEALVMPFSMQKNLVNNTKT
jgi:hypothetical protein